MKIPESGGQSMWAKMAHSDAHAGGDRQGVLMLGCKGAVAAPRDKEMAKE